MNDQKICFICCYKDEEKYFNLAESISKLKLPTGYESEIFSVTEVENIFEAYNAVMEQSDAKYKVYVRENVEFVKDDFLIKVIDIFKKNIKLGMLGVTGAKTIPESGLWEESNHKYGMYFEDNNLKAFNKVTKDYEYVKIIDGSIIITQYDMKWREDIFKGWSFYNVIQSLEFAMMSYDVGVINQDEPYIKVRKEEGGCKFLQHNHSIFIEKYWSLVVVQFYKFGFNSVLGQDCELFGGHSVYIGNGVFVKKGSWFNVPFDNFKGEPQIVIDDGCQIGRLFIVNAANKVYIGKNVLFGPNVYISDCNHEYKNIGVPIMSQGVTSLTNRVHIDSDCWIGSNAVIVGNVRIGKGSVIGANTLVNKDVPDYCIAVGNPAKVIKAYDSRKKDWVKVLNKDHLKDILAHR